MKTRHFCHPAPYLLLLCTATRKMKRTQRNWERSVVPGEIHSTLALSMLSLPLIETSLPTCIRVLHTGYQGHFLYFWDSQWSYQGVRELLRNFIWRSLLRTIYLVFYLKKAKWYKEVTMDLDWEDFRFKSCTDTHCMIHVLVFSTIIENTNLMIFWKQNDNLRASR